MAEHSLLYPINAPERTSIKLDGMWRFRIDWDSCGEREGWQSGIPGHEMIPVPSSPGDTGPKMGQA